jgi:hypothetical protein
MITLFNGVNGVAILCPNCDFITLTPHGFLPPRRLLSHSTTTDPDIPRWYRLSCAATMLSVKTEPGTPASPVLKAPLVYRRN